MDRVGSLELNRTGFSVAEAEVSRELTEDEKRRITEWGASKDIISKVLAETL